MGVLLFKKCIYIGEDEALVGLTLPVVAIRTLHNKEKEDWTVMRKLWEVLTFYLPCSRLPEVMCSNHAL